jgi:hypothetical protein
MTEEGLVVRRVRGSQNPPDMMKTFLPFPRSIMYPLVRLLRTLLLVCTAACSWAEVEIFELRTTASFYGQAVTQTEGGANYGIGTFAFSEEWSGVASLTNVGIDPDATAQQWTFTADGWSATVDATTMAAARNGDHVLWLDFSNLLNAVPLRHFLIPSDCGGHALALVQTDAAGGSPVIGPMSVEAGDFGLSGFAARRASALVDMAKPFWVVDFTTASRSPTGATFLRDGWAADGASYRIASVSFILDAVCAGEHYTLHWQLPGQAEVLQSLTAASSGLGWVQLGDWSQGDQTGTVSVTGSVALGADYWLTRDSDGWNCGSRNLDPFAARPNPLLWSLRGAAAPPVPWQTVTFNIASGMGWGASVAQPDGTRSLSPTYNGTFTLPDLDEWGNPHDFYYEQWTAQIDPRASFWLTVYGTQCSQGGTWFYNGWSAIGGTAKNPQAVTFGIASGVAWNQSVNDSSGSQGLSLSTSGLQIQDYHADGTPNFFNYDLWNATVDVNRPYFLVVNGSVQPANATWFTNGWQWQGGTALPENWQTLSFMIASGCGWGNATVTQASGSWGLNFTGQSGFFEDYTAGPDGSANFFYYDLWSAPVDINRPFTLTVNGTALPAGVTTFTNGWVAQGGPKPARFTLALSLNGDRASHDFTLTGPGGVTWPWIPNGVGSPEPLSIWDPWTSENWDLSSSVFSATWSDIFTGTNGIWTLTDNTTGDAQSFTTTLGAQAYLLDARQWWLPAQSFGGLQISLSRWSHDLTIRQRGGGEYAVSKLSSEGGFTPGAGSYQPYYCFDATGFRRLIPGMDWWIYDATTGESAALNTTELADWSYTPTPVNVAVVQSEITAVDLTWELPNHCGTEMLASGFAIEAYDPASQTWGPAAPPMSPPRSGSRRPPPRCNSYTLSRRCRPAPIPIASPTPTAAAPVSPRRSSPR